MGKTTAIDVKFHDPSSFLKDAVLHYFWFINTVNYGQTLTGHFEYNFTAPGEYDIEVTAIAYFNTNTSKHTDAVSLSYDIENRGLAVREGKQERPSKGVKMAIFQKKLVTTSPVNYLTALTSCISMGATLASVETEEEYNAVYSLTGSTGAWIGLADFLDEGNFSWIDGAVYDPATSYSNWMNNQPNNANINQYCVWIRPDGRWDDITCKKSEAYVCQKTARS